MEHSSAERNRATDFLASFDKPPFIFFEGDPFTHLWFYRPHFSRHLAQALVDIGWPVIYVDPPDDHAERRDLSEPEEIQFGIWRLPTWRSDPDEIRSSLLFLARLFPDSPWVFRHPNWMPLVRLYDFPGRLVVYDTRSFGMKGAIHQDVPVWERHLACIADLVLTNSVSSLIRWSAVNEHTVYLRNGKVTSRHVHPRSRSPELERIPRPRLLVLNHAAGVLDPQLIAFVTQTKPNWSIVVIGHELTNGSSQTNQPNIHYLGERLWVELPIYTHHCDVGLVPFIEQPCARELSPTVVNDYRAGSLPVISTFLPELLLLDDPNVHVTSDWQSFLAAIESALFSEEKDHRPASTIDFEDTWHEQAQKLVDLLYTESSLRREVSSYPSIIAKYYRILKDRHAIEGNNFLVTEEFIRAAYAHGRYEEVSDLAHPSMPIFGSALVRLAEVDRAREWLEHFLAHHKPDDISLIYHLRDITLFAYILALNGEFAEALKVLGEEATRDPVHQVLAARLWFELGFLDNAAFFYGEVTGHAPDLLQATDYLNIGDIMIEAEQLSDAEEAYVQASLLGATGRAQEKLATLYQQTCSHPRATRGDKYGGRL